MSDHMLVSTTAGDEAAAREIARQLVERRLAACVQVVGPIASVYWWQGRVESSEEWLCLIKTRADRLARLETELGELHPYELPELVAVPIERGGAAYLRWLDESLEG